MSFKPIDSKKKRYLYNFLKTDLKQFDPDYYYASFFFDWEVRRRLFALYSFFMEIERITFLVKDKMAGKIRLFWRRDHILELYQGKKADSPGLEALHELIQENDIDREAIEKVMGGYLDLITGKNFETEQEIDSLIQQIYVEKIKMAFKVIAFKYSKESPFPEMPALAFAGEAIGYCHFAGELGHYLTMGRCPIPQEYSEKAGVDKEDLLNNPNRDSLRKVQKFFLGRAEKAYQKLKKYRGESFSFPLFLPSCLVPAYIKAFSKPEYNPFTIPYFQNLSELYRKYKLVNTMFKGHI